MCTEPLSLASEVKCGSCLTVQREALRQLRTIVTSPVNNTLSCSACAEKSAVVAEDKGIVSPSAGQSSVLTLDAQEGHWQCFILVAGRVCFAVA